MEPLPTDLSDLKHGQAVMAIGRDGCVVGEFVDETQYDLILQPKPGEVAGKATFAVNMQDGTLAIDRNGILGISVTNTTAGKPIL